MTAEAIQIFEYLLAVKNLTVPIVRDIREYSDQSFWQADLPKSDGCFLQGAGPDMDAWLEVHKQKIPPSPNPPKELLEWLIEKGENPEKPPTRHIQLNQLTLQETRDLIEISQRVASLKSKLQYPLPQISQPTLDQLFEHTHEFNDDLVNELTIAEERLRTLERKKEVRFDADLERVNAWDKWLDEEWKLWAKDALPRTKVQRLYGNLFSLYQRLQSEGENLELVWGHGFLTWQINKFQVKRPLLTTRVELLFDAKKGVFSITPTEKGTLLELDMLSGIDLPNPSLLVGMERHIQESGIDPWDKQLTIPFLESLANIINEKGKVLLDNEISGNGIRLESIPVIYNAPVLFVRSNTGRQWQNDLRGIIESMREGCIVPETIASLTTTDLILPDESSNREWKSTGEDLLFPLPSNEEQKEITRRLSRTFGVTVQGPPGTGKSHTIVNLIAHLLAHGKRVLVTSQTERALRVLGGMITEKLREIAPLCVSVLGGDSRSTKELEDSITRISDKLASLEPETVEIVVEHLRKDLFACKNEIAQLKTELRDASQADHEEIFLDGRKMLPIEIADWLAQNSDSYNWFPDQIKPDVNPIFKDNEVIKLYDLVGRLSKNDREHALQKRPLIEDLPSNKVLEQIFTKLIGYENTTVERDAKLRGWTLPPTAPSGFVDAVDLINKACEKLEFLTSGWLQHILEDVAYGGQRADQWRDLLKICRSRISSIRSLESHLTDFDISAPEKINFQQTKEDLSVLRSEFERSGGLSFRFRHFTGKKTLYILEEYKLNDSPVKSGEDINVLLHYVENWETKERLVIKWNNSVREVGGPVLTASTPRFTQTLESHLDSIATALNWESEYLKPVLESTVGIKPPEKILGNNLSSLLWFKEALLAYSDRLAEQAYHQRLLVYEQYLEKGIAAHQSHFSWSRLFSALKDRDVQKWSEEISELQRLAILEPLVHELNILREKLVFAAPRWLASIEAEGGAGKALEPPIDWLSAWEWSRANSWLKQHFNRVRTEELYEKLNEARAKEARLTEDLVAQSTWLEQCKRIRENPAQKRSLIAWLQAIRRIGKGTGKYAAKHRADARKEMEICRDAVPVWIMPLNRVIENLKPTSNLFDVVIIDESSQSDLFALSALFRAKRAVVVGDDKQISPDYVGRDLSEVNSLIERHLIGIPQRERFSLQDSLYDTALRIFPGQLMLKEHFRCVPEIIQFSNDRFYGGSIEPLRIPSANERLNPSVVAIRVPEGRRDEGTRDINEPEAQAIAEKIEELCELEEYKNRTMGVISLLGKEQAQLIEQLLREKLGEREMVDRHFVCGDSYSFQGDERDVMFLSMVAAPNVRNAVFNKRSQDQRINVAATRARDQLWLFYSIGLEQLNPGDVRYSLLQYCLNPTRVQYEMEQAEEIFYKYGSSKFHKEVYRLIVARGYRVIPEYKVGTHPYRIDNVIEGIQSRLAIECDGDEWHGIDRWEADLERQQVLERVGWKFWRVRGSVFYRDREKAMEPLWQMLSEMGINPEF